MTFFYYLYEFLYRNKKYIHIPNNNKENNMPRRDKNVLLITDGSEQDEYELYLDDLWETIRQGSPKDISKKLDEFQGVFDKPEPDISFAMYQQHTNVQKWEYLISEPRLRVFWQDVWDRAATTDDYRVMESLVTLADELDIDVCKLSGNTLPLAARHNQWNLMYHLLQREDVRTNESTISQFLSWFQYEKAVQYKEMSLLRLVFSLPTFQSWCNMGVLKTALTCPDDAVLTMLLEMDYVRFQTHVDVKDLLAIIRENKSPHLPFMFENIDFEWDEHGEDVLSAAVEANNTALVKYVLRNTTVNPNELSRSILCTAITRCQRDMFDFLIECPQVDASSHDNQAIIDACGYGREYMVTRLMEQDEVDPSARECQALTAASSGECNWKIVLQLLRDSRVKINYLSSTAFNEMMKGNNQYMQYFLLSKMYPHIIYDLKYS